tara:strand:- start:49 stop:240 length:192 start_codon:yes stop_codon:yes gene_type:complete
MANIDELKKAIDHWQKVEDDGGSPSSASKLTALKAQLAGAEKEESVVDDWHEDDATAVGDEEE